ncbi:phage tail tube protein [Roseomonas sp. USHLN139]|uniref:phage tail tube protein n=1 Tax=Roseomonas sp. USHLN139 TaxID=3081298 RepID=UPI003B02347D
MADNSRRLAGTAYLFVDGVQYPIASEPSYRVSTVTRTTLTGMSGVDGYSETPQPGFIAATLRDGPLVSMSDFQDMTNVSVTLQLANGKRVSGTGMWTVETQEVNSTEGTFSVRFEGEDVRDN